MIEDVKSAIVNPRWAKNIFAPWSWFATFVKIQKAEWPQSAQRNERWGQPKIGVKKVSDTIFRGGRAIAQVFVAFFN